MARVQLVVLVGESCLLRDMLARAIGKIETLEVIEQVDDVAGLNGILHHFLPDWVIFSQERLEISSTMDAVIATYPFVHFIAMNPDGAHFSVRWLEPHECSLDHATLPELADLFVNGRFSV